MTQCRSTSDSVYVPHSTDRFSSVILSQGDMNKLICALAASRSALYAQPEQSLSRVLLGQDEHLASEFGYIGVFSPYDENQRSLTHRFMSAFVRSATKVLCLSVDGQRKDKKGNVRASQLPLASDSQIIARTAALYHSEAQLALDEDPWSGQRDQSVFDKLSLSALQLHQLSRFLDPLEFSVEDARGTTKSTTTTKMAEFSRRSGLFLYKRNVAWLREMSNTLQDVLESCKNTKLETSPT